MKLYHCLIALSSFASLSLLSACQDEDLGYTSDQIAYRTNFEKMYGSVKDIPTWDFSSYNLRQMGLAGGPSMQNSAATRSAKTHNWNTGGTCHGAIDGATEGNDITKTVSTYFQVPDGTQAWMDDNLKEGINHTTLGTPFKLVKPEPESAGQSGKDFLIIPIYQGHSGMTWDLHLVAEDQSNNLKDYKIWSHSENMKYTEDYKTAPVEFHYNTADVDDEGKIPSPNNDHAEVGGDVYWWETGGVVKGILLYRAFPNFLSASKSGAKLIIEVPSGGSVKAKVTNRFCWYYNESSGNYEKSSFYDEPITAKDGKTSGTIEFDLSGIASKLWWSDNITEDAAMWNLVLEIEEYSGCSFDTFAKDDKRVRIYTQYDYKPVEKKSLDIAVSSSTQNYLYRHTIDRKGVESLPIRIDCSKIKDDFYFYLDVTRGDEYVTGADDQASTGARQRSDKNMMLALADNGTLIDADNLKEQVNRIIKDYGNINTCEYFVIGCEDADKSPSNADVHGSDWDLNDVVFLVVGLSKAPKVKEIIEKRYMIEDLGSTFDFDFNDIVVDVTQEGLKVVGATSYSSVNQFATISHLCGTIPFQLKIGNTVLPYVSDPTNETTTNSELSSTLPGDFDTRAVNWNPNKTITISGWNPSTNNIYVKVWPQKKTSNGAGSPDSATDNFSDFSSIPTEGNFGEMNFGFPNNGDYPYIIAVDPSVDWMPELQSVPSYWFKTWPQQYYDYNHTTPSNPTSPERVAITLQEGNQLNLSDLSNAKTTDKVEFVLSYNGTKDDDGINSDWGIGGFADDTNNESWIVTGTEWKYGGPSDWTHEETVGTIRSLATNLNHNYIKLNLYNGCSIKSVTLVKQ